jgi:uroporphyrinogen-III synthase
MSILAHKRIAITRAEEQSGDLAKHLRSLGAKTLICPAIAFAPPVDPAPLDTAIAQLHRYDWLIVTSANGARALLSRMDALHVDIAKVSLLRVGVVGPATADILAKRDIHPSFIPSTHIAESLLAEIGDVHGQRVLLPRADIARETLVAGLRERGALVDDIAAYRTIRGPGGALLAPVLHGRGVDAITFTSASTVRYLLDGLVEADITRPEARQLLNEITIASIGPVTSQAARKEGLRVDVEAREYTSAGLIEALVAWFAEKQRIRS